MLRRAVLLWKVLDDIEEASKRVEALGRSPLKVDYYNFYKYATRKAKQRHEVLKSDGKRLYLPWYWRLLVWLGIKNK